VGTLLIDIGRRKQTFIALKSYKAEVPEYHTGDLAKPMPKKLTCIQKATKHVCVRITYQLQSHNFVNIST